MQQLTRLETNLADVMIAELAGPQRQIPANDSDDAFPLIEILRDAAFGIDDMTTTSKFTSGALLDADDTVPHALYSTPYERVEVGTELAPPRLPRKRPATITREALVQRMNDRATAAQAASMATTRKHPRFSAPYERIEIVELAEPSATRPSMKALASGSFEVAWFATPDDALVANDEQEVAQSSTMGWLWITAVALVASAIVLLVIAL